MATDNTHIFPEIKEPESGSCLTSLEQAQPLKVLEDFFGFAGITETRANLRDWLLASFHAHNGEQFKYIHLWQQLERLVEANWLLYQQEKDASAGEQRSAI